MPQLYSFPFVELKVCIIIAESLLKKFPNFQCTASRNTPTCQLQGALCQLQLTHFAWPACKQSKSGEVGGSFSLLPSLSLSHFPSQLKLPLSVSSPLYRSISFSSQLDICLARAPERTDCLWRWYGTVWQIHKCIYKIHRYEHSDINFAIITHCLFPATCNAAPLYWLVSPLSSHSRVNRNRFYLALHPTDRPTI